MGCIHWQQELWDALDISWRYDGIYHQHYDPNMYMYIYIYIHVIIIDMYGVGQLENSGKKNPPQLQDICESTKRENPRPSSRLTGCK